MDSAASAVLCAAVVLAAWGIGRLARRVPEPEARLIGFSRISDA